MTLLPAAILILAVAVAGAAFALSAFLWALRTHQFSVKHMNEGAFVIFDKADRPGEPTDQLFKKTAHDPDERTAD